MPRSSGVSFEEGARVVFSDLLQDEGKALAEEIGPSAAFFAGDATSPSDTEALMKFAVEHFGSLDCLVNNAGLAGPNPPIAELPVEKFDQIIAINLRGTFLGIKYALPHMKTGTIINNASVAGFAGGYGPHTYTAAKAGVIGLTKSVALEVGQRGIRVNANIELVNLALRLFFVKLGVSVKTDGWNRKRILDLCCTPFHNLRSRKDEVMADVTPVPAGDVTQRVGVEVIKARGVDVDKLIKMLIANAAAEFASTYYYYTILRMHLAGYEDYKEICEDARLEDRAHWELIVPRIYELGGELPNDLPTFHNQAGCPAAKLPDPPTVVNILTVLLESERCAIRSWTAVCDMTFGKDPRTYDLASRILNEEIEHEAWFIELLAHERDGKSIPSGHFRRGTPGEAPYSKNVHFYNP